MSDWQVGDLALCVDDGPCECGDCGGAPCTAFAGRVYRVRGVNEARQGTNPRHRWVSLDLGLPPVAGHAAGGWAASRFRKIRPDEHEACEEEFRILLKLSKKRVAA